MKNVDLTPGVPYDLVHFSRILEHTMPSLIEHEIKNIREELPKLPALSDEYIYSLMCFKFFYNNGYLSFRDFENCFVDGKDDGGIDFVTVYEDSSNDNISLVLIQSKLVSTLGNTQDILNVFHKMIKTHRDFEDYRYARYNKRLKRILREYLSFLEDKSPSIELVLFINLDLPDATREKVIENIESTEGFNGYNISVFYKADIEEKIRNILNPKRFVDDERIKWSKENGKLEYLENGVMVNISSNSIRDLYVKYKERGLFEQNFRYYIRNKKIDEKIMDSLRTKRNDFWYLNNGIIIGCKDFAFDGDKIHLYDFSIINGCQTVTLIGEYKGKNQNEDFVLPCKIIKPRKDSVGDDEFTSFISEISESSNSQKPITDKDLKSNKPEQKKLQSDLKLNSPKVYLEIKRGERFSKKGLNDWQCVKNDYLGQLILSFNLQKPCTARNNKNKIFSDETVYSRVFKRSHDKDNIVDLLILNSYYQKYLNTTSVEDFADLDRASVADNGTFIIIAVIGFLIKNKRKLVDIKKSVTDEWDDEIQKDNITGKIFSDYTKDDFEDLLNSLFIEIIDQLFNIYKNREGDEKTVSNFFKSDIKYVNSILKNLIPNLYTNPIKKKEIEKYLVIFA